MYFSLVVISTVLCRLLGCELWIRSGGGGGGGHVSVSVRVYVLRQMELKVMEKSSVSLQSYR